MRVLVTGSAGFIGKRQAQALRDAGHEVRTFDRTAQDQDENGEHLQGDIRDIDVVRKAVRGMDAVAHLAAIASDRRGSADEVLTVNVQGTWNALLACVEAGVSRIVYFSSVNALGCVGGHRPADYLPIDDDYPRHPLSPYQLSKHLAEEACRSFSEKHGLVTICLRPVFVTTTDHYAKWRQHLGGPVAQWQADEYWAYVDVRDVCAAALSGLTVQDVSHAGFLLTADDTTVETPTAELVDTYYPTTPWKQGRAAYLAENPHRSLMDCAAAKQVLGWQPQHSWRSPA